MTPDQLQHFSREWQNLFTDLQKRGYTVEYDNGIIRIQNVENQLNARLVGGRWWVELEKPFGEPFLTKTKKDTAAIGRIEHLLYQAKVNPREYSFRVLNRLVGTVMTS